MDQTAGGTGISTAALGRLDRHLQEQYIDKERIAGCLTLISRRGELAHLSALGSMDRERGKPMQTDAIFRIYSMTKPITSVALMMLFEEGKLQLTDAVRRYIPSWGSLQVMAGGEWPDFEVAAPERPMTIRDLLSHQSGLTYGFMEGGLEKAYNKAGVYNADTMRGRDLQSMIDRLAGLPLKFPPGTAWNYGVSTDVCGYLVQEISGRRFDEYLRERIFEPLGMEDTGFHVPPEKAGRFTANYERGPDRKLRLLDDPGDSHYLEEQTFFSGGGGLVSTADDYHRFCRMLLGKGELDGARILGRKTVEYMTRNHLPGGRDLAAMGQPVFSETPYDGIGFGLGFSVVLDPAAANVLDSPGEFAWGGAASTYFWVDPAEALIVIFMTQLLPSSAYPIRRELKATIYPALID